MRIYRQGKRYTACVDAARALQVRSTLDERLSVAQLAEMDVFNEKDEQVGDVDRLAQGQDQRIYVLMTYRGPRWPANKQVAVPLDHMTLNHGKLLLPGVGEQDLLAMPAVPADGGMYRSLRATELVSVRSSAASPTGTGNIRRQP
ncbi:hypothetical protein IC232_27095 [Microvirga sp. BT688]|uniref:hypothetical protein n=1 Tax=Microvirga sp. TaxID=1873136 RepID=UPI00168401B7|nr:hypothetical protein [Microvirga sp.]MBD2750330.1 hypothetical protein [Microvirga sp.]